MSPMRYVPNLPRASPIRYVRSSAQNQHRHQAGEQKSSESAHYHQTHALAAECAELDRSDGAALLPDLEHPRRGEGEGGIALVFGQFVERDRSIWSNCASATQFRQESTLPLELTCDAEAGEGNRDECRR